MLVNSNFKSLDMTYNKLYLNQMQKTIYKVQRKSEVSTNLIERLAICIQSSFNIPRDKSFIGGQGKGGGIN